MALISDYASLTQAIQDFTHRTDIAPYTDYFIQAAQEVIANDIFDRNQGNGLRLQEASYSQVIANGVTTVPTDWLSPKSFQAVGTDGSLQPLIFVDPTALYEMYPMREADNLPKYIARDGSNFQFGPYPDSTYTIQGTYYQAATLLTAQATTNWMVTSCPTILHAQCMVRAAAFLKDQQMAQGWAQLYDVLLQGLIDRDKAERWAGATMAMQVA